MRIRLFVVLICSIALFGGCQKESCTPPTATHTLLVYMAAENNLGGWDASNNLNKMMAAVSANHLNGGRLLIFIDQIDETPVLFELKRNSNGRATKIVLKNYPELNSASAKSVSEVVSDLRRFAPAQSYGLILWSHGTGWLPANSPYGIVNNRSAANLMQAGAIRDPNHMGPRTRAFGQDGKQWLELSDLALALPNNLFEYILFDACFMGEAEVAYALRNKTHYLMASSAEILAEGMPYDLILGNCFKRDYPGVCKSYFDYYNAKIGDYRSATFALYDCTQMEALAEVLKPIISRFATQLPTLNISTIQRFDRNTNHTMFDMSSVVSSLITETADPQRTAFEEQLKQTVVVKYNTPWMFNSFQVKTFCGISMYIPRVGYTDLNPSFLNTEWCKAIYGN